MRGVVHATGGGVYHVVSDGGDRIEASIRGRLKREPRTGGGVVIGDRVRLARADDAWTVEEVEPRENELVRRGRRGRDAKVVAANLTGVFAVVAAAGPRASTQLVDRLLVVAEASGFRARLVVNKTDLEGASEVGAELAGLYESIGYEVYPVSARTRDGLDRLEPEICRGKTVLIGPSGVGKSSLLNALDPRLDLRTGELSRKTRTGRHTTVSSRLIELACGGLVADTPGVGDVGVWRVPAGEVEACFPELAEPAAACRFRGCAHVAEPDCAVREAVEAGRIAGSRYRSYLRIRQEAEGS